MPFERLAPFRGVLEAGARPHRNTPSETQPDYAGLFMGNLQWFDKDPDTRAARLLAGAGRNATGPAADFACGFGPGPQRSFDR
jgi:hypothetical protein